MRVSLLRPEVGPATLKITRWGGRRLAALRGAPPEAAVGESWEFSTLPGSESRADGRPLADVLGGPLPFLAKLLDTALPLSVQVHPGDGPDGPGKEEAWIVLDADPGACVWAGLAHGCTRKQFADAVARGAPCMDLLRRVPVVAGTVVLVPARCAHAIGPGILLAEIQQPRDATLRFYDHGSERPIQPAAALELLDTGADAVVWQPQDPPRPIRGRHVALELLGPGEHARDLGPPTLLVPARGRVHARAGADSEALSPGALRLAPAGAWRLAVEPGGLCVAGTVA